MRHELDDLLLAAVERPDEGFTAGVMAALPPPQRARNWGSFGVWAATALIVLALAWIGLRDWSEHFTWATFGALACVGLALWLTHVETEDGWLTQK